VGRDVQGTIQVNGTTIHVHDPGDEHQTKLNLKKVDITDFDGVDHSDCPDYCDAFASEATYKNRDMTEKELDLLNENYSEYVYERLMDHLY